MENEPQEQQAAEKPVAKETHATPTSSLKFVDGDLHQLFQVQYDDGSSRPEFRPVPSESTSAPQGI